MFAKLTAWSQREFSHLPWRKRRTLYRTLISEIMLQQTTVATVAKRFESFVERFPDLENLACATEEELVSAWKGLGYYRRAKNLRPMAIGFLESFGGSIPMNFEKLTSVPGIGPYSAAALLGIGRDYRALPLDANLERVLARFYALAKPKGAALKKELRERFARGEILPDMEHWGVRALIEALMDLGRTFCRAKVANCQDCPLATDCQAKRRGRPLDFPIQGNKGEGQRHYRLDLLRVVVWNNGRILGHKKGVQEWLSGQIELPTFILQSEDQNLRQYPFADEEILLGKTPVFKTGITKYRITNHVLVCSLEKFQTFPKKMRQAREYQLYPWETGANFSTASLKALKLTGDGFSDTLKS